MTAYSALMLAARITLAHFSVSSAMSEPTRGVPPKSANRALILGSASPDALVEFVEVNQMLAQRPRKPV